MVGSNRRTEARRLRSLVMRSTLALMAMLLAAGTLTIINSAPADAAILPDTVIATIGGFNGAWGTAVNPVTDNLYVANINSNNISVIDASTDSVTTTIPVGTTPYAVAVNSVTNTVYAANANSGSVSVINGATNAVTATIPVGSYPAYVKVDPVTNMVYVANGGSGTFSVINGATNAVVSTITGMSNPQGIGVNPATNTIYVANNGSSSVSVINGATNAVTATIPVGSEPQGISVDPQTNTVYVANYGSGSVSVINGATNAVTVDVPVGANPIGVTVDPGNNMIYVNNYGSNTVSVINGLANAVVDSINVGSGPTGISVDPQTNLIYTANYGSNTVSVIAGATPAWNYPQSNTPVSVGSQPYKVAVNPVTNLAYVTNYASSSVSVVNTTTNAVTATIGGFNYPGGVAVNSANNLIYVTNINSNTVSVINGATNAVTATINVGSAPEAAAFDPVTNMIYTANTVSNSVSVINGATNTVTATIPVGSYPKDVAVNSVTNTIYVANYSSSSVSVINGATNTVTATIYLNSSYGYPDAIAVDSANNTIWTANANHTVSVINGITNTVTDTISGWITPEGIAVDPLTGMVYVSDGDINAQRVYVVDGATGQIADSLAVGTGAMGMAVNPNNNTAYVVLSGSNNMQELSWISQGTSYRFEASIRTSTTQNDIPNSVAVNPVTNMAYVTDSTTGGVDVINGSTKILQTTIPGATTSPFSAAVNSATNMVYADYTYTGSYGYLQAISGKSATTTSDVGISQGNLRGVDVNPNTNTIYIASYNGYMFIVNGATNAVSAEISLGGSAPFGVAVDPVTNLIYVSQLFTSSTTSGNNVWVMNGSNLALIATINLGANYQPHGVAVNTVTNMIYTANTVSNTVSVINGATNTVTATIPVGTGPTSITTDYITNTIYVGNSGSATISVIDGSTNAVVATIPAPGFPPTGMAMNNRTNELYVTTGNGSAPAMTVFTGRLLPTTVSAITTSANPAYVGTPVTYTATVSPAPEFATMDFTSDGTTIAGCGYVPVNKSTGVASCTTTYSGTGTHSIVATNSGDVNYAPSVSPTLSEVINQVPTATSLSSSANPVLSDNLVTYTATVSPTVGGAPTPTGGTVGFSDNGTAINGCTAQSLNSSGQATCELPYAAPGSHAIVASYSGSTDYVSSTSNTLTETITSPTVSAPSVSPGSATLSVGQSTILTATASNEPNGTSIVMNLPSGVSGNTPIGCYNSTSGNMTCSETVVSNTAGTYNFTATANLAGNMVQDSSLTYATYPNNPTWGPANGAFSTWGTWSWGPGGITMGSGNGDFSISGGTLTYIGTGAQSPNGGFYSQTVSVTPGATYSFSADMNATYVSNSSPYGPPGISIYDPVSYATYFEPVATPGQSGLVSGTWTDPAGLTQVMVTYYLKGAIVAAGEPLTWSNIQLTQTSSVQPYAPGAIAASSATSNSVSVTWQQPLTPPTVSASPTTQTVANSVTITAVGNNEGTGVTIAFNNPTNVSQVSQSCSTSGSTITCTESVTTTVAGTYDFSATAYPPPGVNVAPESSNVVGVTWNQPTAPGGMELMPT